MSDPARGPFRRPPRGHIMGKGLPQLSPWPLTGAMPGLPAVAPTTTRPVAAASRACSLMSLLPAPGQTWPRPDYNISARPTESPPRMPTFATFLRVLLEEGSARLSEPPRLHPGEQAATLAVLGDAHRDHL